MWVFLSGVCKTFLSESIPLTYVYKNNTVNNEKHVSCYNFHSSVVCGRSRIVLLCVQISGRQFPALRRAISEGGALTILVYKYLEKPN
jgi:hypothetical protein